MSSKSGYRWFILVMAWLIYFSFGLISAALAPLVTPIMNDLEITFTQMGIVSGAWQLVYIFAAQPLGLLIDLQGTYKSLLFGIIIISISSILRGFAKNFGTLFLFVALFGIGGIMISVGLPKLISRWFVGKERGTAIGINVTGSTTGNMVAMSITNSIALPIFGCWENVFFVYGFFGIIIAVFWLFSGRRSPPIKQSESINDKIERISAWDVLKNLFKLRNVRIIIIIGVSSFLINHGLSSWLPKLFEQKGMKPVDAGFLASSFTLFGVLGSLTIPRLSYFARSKKKVLSILLFILGVACLIIGVGHGFALLMGLFFAGITGKALTPILQVILMDMPEIGSRYMGAVGGMYFSIGEIGGFSGPFLMGYLRDLTGSFLSGIVFLSVFSEVMILIVALLRTNASKKQE